MSILQEIISHTREELVQRKCALTPAMLKELPGYERPTLSLCKALRTDSVAIIAEIKKASPSKKVIRQDFDPVTIAADYVAGGASAISVLTEHKYFQGNIDFIAAIRPLVPIPILRKDFIIDAYQLTEAKAYGADAVLLIAAALDPIQLRELHLEANALGLDCLVEVHNERELATLDFAKIRIVGINNRNLSDFSVDMVTTSSLVRRIPPEITVVSESGISSRRDIEEFGAKGVHAVLVGEHLMRSPRPIDALRALLTASEDSTR